MNSSNIIYLQRGGEKSFLKEEQVTRNFAFASIVSVKKILKGEKLSKNNIWVKRPGTGHFSAENYKYVLGKKASRIIKKNYQIKKNDIA